MNRREMLMWGAMALGGGVTTTAVSGDDDAADGSPDFRVTIRVAEAVPQGPDGPRPISEHRLIFRGGMVYDVTQQPASRRRFVTVFDPQRTRIVLLDRQSLVRCTVSTDHLVELAAKARAATESPERREALGLAAAAEVDESGQRFAIRFGRVAYETDSQLPDHPQNARAFASLSDWAARLNMARQVNTPPPFGRMTLNRALAAAGRMPRDLSISVRQDSGEIRYQVGHEYAGDLTDADRRETREIDGWMIAYREIPFRSFPE